MLSKEVKLAALGLYQDVTIMAQEQSGLDPVERLIVMHVVAAELRFGEEEGTSVSAIARASGRPHSTIDTRVQKLIEQGVLGRSPLGGVVLADERIRDVWEGLIYVVVARVRPVYEQIVREMEEAKPSRSLPGSL